MELTNKIELGAYFYNDAFSENYAGDIYGLHYTKSPYHTIWNHALKIIKKVKNPKIIEIGCGVGQFAHMLFDNGITDYIGFDFSYIAVDKAKLLCRNTPFLFYEQDLKYTTLIYNECDLFICFEVLEHIKDDLRFLNRLPVGSHILISFPNYDSQSHVRFFKTIKEVENRYKHVLDIRYSAKFTVDDNTTFFLIDAVKREVE